MRTQDWVCLTLTPPSQSFLFVRTWNELLADVVNTFPDISIWYISVSSVLTKWSSHVDDRYPHSYAGGNVAAHLGTHRSTVSGIAFHLFVLIFLVLVNGHISPSSLCSWRHCPFGCLDLPSATEWLTKIRKVVPMVGLLSWADITIALQIQKDGRPPGYRHNQHGIVDCCCGTSRTRPGDFH